MQIRSNDIATILDACLERIQRGESIDACMLDYPSEAEELEPLLIAVTYARRSYKPPALAPEARQMIRRQLQQAVAARQPAPPRPISWARPLMRFALALVVALLCLGGGVAAAQSSLPGSSLYPLKRADEDVRLILAYNSTQRAVLHLDFAAARSAEILQLVNGGQQAIDSGLVDDLEQEYQLAWQEIEHVPAAEVHDLARQYVIQRQTDVTVFSTASVRANTATGDQIQRALQLGKQALAVVGPAEAPAARPTPNNGTTNGSGSSNHQGQGNNAGSPGDDNAHSSGASASGGKPTEIAPTATPNAKPSDTRPTPTPKAKPTATSKPTPEGKPDNAGPPATPEAKPNQGNPDNGAGKPDESKPNQGNSDDAGGKHDESKPDNGSGKSDAGDSKPKPKPGKP